MTDEPTCDTYVATEVPDELCRGWTKTLDVLAKIMRVPAALIMQVHSREIEVFAKSSNDGNVYEVGETAPLNTGLYCETVMKTRAELLVANALADPAWDHNPDIKLGMISYLGLPLLWPTREIFGTICVLDVKENGYSALFRDLLRQFRDMVQADLALLHKNGLLNEQISRRIHAERMLQKERDQLEESVRRRTIQFEQTNEALQCEVADHGRTEAALLETEERYRALVECSPSAILVLQEGRYTYSNPAGAKMFGFEKPSDVVGIAAFDYIVPEDHPMVLERLKTLDNGWTNKPVELRIRRQDGSVFTVESVSARVMLQGKPAVMIIASDVTDRVMAEAEQRRYQQRLKALGRALATAETRERRCLAEDLHDGLAQTIFAARLKIELLMAQTSDQEQRVRMAAIEEMLAKSLKDIREMTFELCPPVLYESGLEPALCLLASQFKRRHSIECSVCVSAGASKLRLSDELLSVVFRAVGELLSNVAKHAQAQNVRVSLDTDGELLHVSVEDDGAGFSKGQDPGESAETESFGLFNIRERLADYDGNLTIHSEHARGSTIHMAVPLADS